MGSFGKHLGAFLHLVTDLVCKYNFRVINFFLIFTQPQDHQFVISLTTRKSERAE
jgi:hypothetical protein